MRKLILELKPNEMIRDVQSPIFEHFHSYEVLERLKINWEAGLKIDLIECVMKRDIALDGGQSIGHIEILSVMKSEG